MVGGVLKLEINIPLQRIRAKRKGGGGGLINEGGVILSEYGTSIFYTPLSLTVNLSFSSFLSPSPATPLPTTSTFLQPGSDNCI